MRCRLCRAEKPPDEMCVSHPPQWVMPLGDGEDTRLVVTCKIIQVNPGHNDEAYPFICRYCMSSIVGKAGQEMLRLTESMGGDPLRGLAERME